MDIGRTDAVGGPGSIGGPGKIMRSTPSAAPSGTGSADKVDLSAKAGMISKALAMPEVRLERVAEIKKLITLGSFETDARLEGAMKRFMAENSDL